MNTQLWNLGSRDLIMSLVVAVFTPIVVTLADAMRVPGFDFMNYDWGSLLALGVGAGLAYLAKNFASDSKGRLFGTIG